MKSIIVGTAGHIDHGKTALVKALTGIDADRLEEEKRRGITIDLGFAHMDLPAGADETGGNETARDETLRLGFVDVPGHERFVRNMLAGVGGIDLVLLVIAADEAIKPQTREHFDILQLLGVQRGIAVLTKSDAVDAETLDVVRLEVEEFLRGTFLDQTRLDKPNSIVAVSSLTGAGLEDLKRAIVAAAAAVRPRDSQAIARLPIDRVFTMKGFGTVVTGTLVAGTIRREDELEVFPAGLRVRVRGVQVHGQAAEAAVAGQRTALNLAGASVEDLARGMTLAPAATFSATRRIDVQLRLLASAPRPLEHRVRIHFHAHAMETVAELKLHGQMQIAPGESAFARITLPEPTLLLPGDRFIIRQFSPVVTIGGGVVLDAAPMKRTAGLPDLLRLLSKANEEEIIQARIMRQGTTGITTAKLVSETSWTREKIGKLVAKALTQGSVVRMGDTYVQGLAVETLKSTLVDRTAQFHKQNPLVGGIGREQLREQVKVPNEIFAAVRS